MALGNVVYTPKIPLTRADVVDNLESTAADLPLSARMGNRLLEKMGPSDLSINYLYNPTNIKDFALALPTYGVFFICTSSGVQGLPPGQYAYSNGLIFRRMGGTTNILLFSYEKSEMAVATCLNDVWSDWRKVSTEAF